MDTGTNGDDPATCSDSVWDSARREIGGGLLSIVMPVHNLGAGIGANLRHVETLFTGRLPFEIVVVDDGSDDDTCERIRAASAELATVRAVCLERNMGKGAALRRGFQASHGTHILLLDADLDLPPAQVSGFFRIMEERSADIVIGSKRHPESQLRYPWYRKLVSNVYYIIVRLLIGLPVRDTQTGIKLFKREALAYVLRRMLVKRFAFDLEILAIAHERGFRISEAPVTLDFTATFGCFRPSTVKQTMTDTLAIFYRLKLLKYYRTVRETRMPTPPPLVSIVIAFPSVTDYIDECLAAIRRQTYRDYEVVLLPNDASGRDWGPDVREMATGPRRPAEKRNIGIEIARGSIVAFLDDDTIPTEDWLRRAVSYFGEDKIAAVGGPATTPASDPYLAALSGRVYSNPLVSGSFRYRYEPDRVREVDDFPSCNLLVRTDILRELGGFHTEFWPGEDTYLCLDIVHKLERTIIYDPWVHVYHHRRSLFLPHLRQIGRYALHRGYFARRFPATSRKPAYAVPSLFVLGLVAGAVLATLSPMFRILYGAALWFYVGVTLASCFPWESFFLRLRLNPITWLLTWLGVVLTHLVYGIRFVAGLLARRLPETVQRFDHRSEANALGGMGQTTETGRHGGGGTERRNP